MPKLNNVLAHLITKAHEHPDRAFRADLARGLEVSVIHRTRLGPATWLQLKRARVLPSVTELTTVLRALPPGWGWGQEPPKQVTDHATHDYYLQKQLVKHED